MHNILPLLDENVEIHMGAIRDKKKLIHFGHISTEKVLRGLHS